MFFINLRNDKIIPNAASEDNKKMQGFFRAWYLISLDEKQFPLL